MRYYAILVSVLLCCALLLTACPKQTTDETGAQTAAAVNSGDDGMATATGLAAQWPENWPAELPQYPGSTLNSSHIGSDAGEEKFLGVALVTSDAEDKVLEYYSEHALAAGWKSRGTTEAEGQRADHYISADGKLMFNIMCEPTDGGNAVSLMVAENLMGDETAEGSDESGEATVDIGEEEPVEISTGKLPEGFPVNVLKPYPAGEVIQAMTQGEDCVLSMTTKDSVQQVADYYIAHFTGRGWAKGDDIDMTGSRMIAFNSKSGEVAFTVTDGGDARALTLVLMPGEDGANTAPGEGSEPGSSSEAGGSSDAGATGSAVAITNGKLPEGFPTNILPLYPGAAIEAAAINGNEYTLLQVSADRDDQLVKHYDKLFREAGWKKESSVTVSGTYYGGWHKDGDQIDMTATKRGDNESFISLVYTDN